MKSKGKLIYIAPGNPTFVQRDINFLLRSYTVIPLLYPWSPKIRIPLLFFRQAVEITRYLHSAKAIIVMFGGYWSLIPSLFGKLFNRPVYIIPGGTDCVSFPELNYGSLRKPLLRIFIKWSYQLCTRLAPVDHSLALSDYSYDTETTYPKQGFRYFFPKLTTPHTVIYNGFDPEFWNRDHFVSRNLNSFITVGTIPNETRFILKGMDLVCHLAGNLPQSEFIIIGISAYMKTKIPPDLKNVRCYDFLSADRIKALLSGSEFYLQLSVSEGFPNALCEAMLCECIPIGSNVGAIASIIGDSGYVVPKRDEQAILEKVKNILSMDPGRRKALGASARQRIIENFSLSDRERALVRLIEGTME
ncbi:MAG TPA: glycosyltransferase family 4 protein [Bacteroidales bacterium]|nr:glycosyltransferase family 4 protein [Bacteroidales bacterium]HNS47583.1 glycosyltransferase family 4 protein [Bacteroidales bacterium]